MLASSSKRAISSTTTVTSLPLRAASIRISISSESVPVRYTVCLIATTLRVARRLLRMNSITGRNDWNGWCSRMSLFAHAPRRCRAPAASAVGRPGWNGGNLRSGRSTWSGTLMQPHQVHRAVDAVEVVLVEAELLQQEVATMRCEQLSATSSRTASPKWRCGSSPCSAVRRFFTSSSSTKRSRVARDAELVAAQHLHAGEELADVRVQDRGEEHEVVLGAARRPAAGGSRAAARAAPARSPRRELRPKASLALELDGEVEALVEHARERVRRVEPDRRQHRHHLAEEVVADPLPLRRRSSRRAAGSGCPRARAPAAARR